ncbi:MAG TPA: hypothetical protein VF665_00455 [Longimicrobium sp.]|jgi:hypothetical protein|uniref:hypothetical protein n=1 Tax=Longimicrobium sp. TaxID=2029185 RepID=UPI002ED9715D
MTGFNDAVGEYLCGDGPSRPWTPKQEEDTLRGLAAWMQGRVAVDSVEAVTPDVLRRYAEDRHLSDEELDDLQGTVASLRMWARRRGDVEPTRPSRA